MNLHWESSRRVTGFNPPSLFFFKLKCALKKAKQKQKKRKRRESYNSYSKILFSQSFYILFNNLLGQISGSPLAFYHPLLQHQLYNSLFEQLGKLIDTCNTWKVTKSRAWSCWNPKLLSRHCCWQDWKHRSSLFDIFYLSVLWFTSLLYTFLLRSLWRTCKHRSPRKLVPFEYSFSTLSVHPNI